MALVSVHRGASALPIILDGAQTVTGTLDFGAGTEVVLDPTIYNVSGRYVLFIYGTAPLNFANLTVDGSEIAALGLTAGVPVNDTANSRITVDVQ